MRNPDKLLFVSMLAVCTFLASSRASFAFGLSPPEVQISRTLYSSSYARETVGLQRGEGEVGALVFSVGFHGECDGCVSGDNTVVMGPDEESVAYEFTVAPGAEIETGDYKNYIAFLLDEAGEGGESTGNAVQRGVTATVRFSVNGGSSGGGGGGSTGGGGSSGGGGGGSPGGSTDTETPTTDEPADGGTATDSGSAAGPGGSVEPAPSEATDRPPASTTEPAPSSEASESSGSSDAAPASAETAPATSPACANPDFSLDKDGDGSVTGSDMTAFADAYLAASCSVACDANADCAFDLRDIAIIAERIGVSPDHADAVPPVVAGAAMETDEPVFYFEKGGEVGRYQFVLASADQNFENLITFYLLADTGLSGLRAADVSFSYDPSVMRLVDVSSLGSVFPNLRGAYGTDGDGSIRFVAASPDAFVGTRGYVASFQFQPLREGDTALAFRGVDTVGGSIETVDSSDAKDLAGRLAASGSATTAGRLVSAVSAAACGCLSPKKITVCAALSLALAFAIVALFALRKIQKNEGAVTAPIE